MQVELHGRNPEARVFVAACVVAILPG